MPTADDQLTAEQLAAANPNAAEVAAAGVKAAAAAKPGQEQADAATAIKKEADSQRIPMTEEEAKMIAGAIVAQMPSAEEQADAIAERFSERGAFDSPEPTVTAPPQTVPDEHAHVQAPPEPEAPRKRTWAERFRGA